MSAAAGQPFILTLNFYDEQSGTLTDPASVQLDITYGQEVGFVPDTAGPFTYSGASVSTPGQVWRISTGQYAFTWQIPPDTPAGGYVANWTAVYQGDSFLGTENFWVAGGVPVDVPAGDTGFWSGSLAYTPSAGTPASPVTIDFGSVDSSGICWLWQKLEGWDGPDVQGAGVIARSGDHGAWAAPQYFAARTMTLTVTASAPSQALRDQARSVLQSAVPVSDLALLTYNEPIPKQALVRRSGKITESYPTLADVTFSVGLVAPDPRKYGTVLRTLTVGLPPVSPGGGMVVPISIPFTTAAALPPGAAVASNAGNFGSPPIAVIYGPVSGPALTNVTTGNTVSWSNVTLQPGWSMFVDFLNRQSWVNPLATPSIPGVAPAGGQYTAADLSSAWWQLAPGDNAIELTGSAGTGSYAQFSWSDSWI